MKTLTTKEFIDSCTVTHDGFYSYEKTVYKSAKEKLVVTCPLHGDFSVVAYKHKSGVTCRKCADTLKATSLTDFIIKCNTAHKNKFDYSKVVLDKGVRSKIKVICPVHGEFTIQARSHSGGSGCKKCTYAEIRRTGKYKVRSKRINGTKKKLTNDAFIKRCQDRHGNTYDYSLVEYKGYHSKVKIICKEHGVFEQRAGAHYDGHICPTCSSKGRSLHSTSNINIYLMCSDDMFKVGITAKSVEERAEVINMTSPQKFSKVFSKLILGSVAVRVERSMLRWLRTVHKQPIDKFDGYRECFYMNSLSLPQIIDKLLEFEDQLSKSIIC